jgi:hypothetical protein
MNYEWGNNFLMQKSLLIDVISVSVGKFMYLFLKNFTSQMQENGHQGLG